MEGQVNSIFNTSRRAIRRLNYFNPAGMVPL